MELPTYHLAAIAAYLNVSPHPPHTPLHTAPTTVAAICKEHGISSATLYSILARNDLPLRTHPHRKQHDLTYDQAAERVTTMYNQGYPIKAIRYRVHRGNKFIYSVLHSHGITLRRRGEQ